MVGHYVINPLSTEMSLSLLGHLRIPSPISAVATSSLNFIGIS